MASVWRSLRSDTLRFPAVSSPRVTRASSIPLTCAVVHAQMKLGDLNACPHSFEWEAKKFCFPKGTPQVAVNALASKQKDQYTGKSAECQEDVCMSVINYICAFSLPAVQSLAAYSGCNAALAHVWITQPRSESGSVDHRVLPELYGVVVRWYGWHSQERQAERQDL